MVYQKKPLFVEAMCYDGGHESLRVIREWAHEGRPGAANAIVFHNGIGCYVRTSEGVMSASVGDWIIKGVKGEFYPCKPDIFELTYDAVLERG